VVSSLRYYFLFIWKLDYDGRIVRDRLD